MTHAQATVDNTTRRRDFLALTAAATTVMAARPALASPAVANATELPDTTRAGQGLKDAVRALGESHDALEAARRGVNEADLKVSRWEEEHPEPAGKRPRKRWARNWRGYREEVCGGAWEAQLDAENNYRKAQWTVAKIQPVDRHELALMAAAAAIYDKAYIGDRYAQVALISYGVVLGYFRLSHAGEAGV